MPVSGPQLSGSVSVFVHIAPQSSGFAPSHAQEPASQTAPGLQSVPHDPQAPASVWRSRQRGERLAQSVSEPHWQAPPLQVAVPPHLTPQPPQLFGSVW